MSDRVVLGRRVAGALLFFLALLASVAAGAPTGTSLPETALGWTPLLHVERAAVAVVILGALGLVIWRAGEGKFPSRFGQIEYATQVVAEELDLAVSGHDWRIARIERMLGQGSNGVDYRTNGG